MVRYIGIDPGQSGGIAVLDAEGHVIVASKMPATDADIYSALRVASLNYNTRAVLEFVRSSPQMGVVSAFKFGCSYGGLRMALAANGIPYDEVLPRRWQGALSCLSGGDKNVTKARAAQLFPMLTITHALADALLMAEYCRRLHTGVIAAPAKSTTTKTQEF